MNSSERPEVTVQTLVDLRKEDDALRLITDLLRVKEMGPADHIRTKHEAKQFVETGDVTLAEALIRHVLERHQLAESITAKVTRSQGQRHTP